MTRLEGWLGRATKRLSEEAAAQVREEIEQHYESAFVAAIIRGVSEDDADRAAVASLGDARVANREHRKVLLTASEARVLRSLHWELPPRPFTRWFYRLGPMLFLAMSAMSFSLGQAEVGRVQLAAAIVGFVSAAQTFPIYTLSRTRIFRYAKWASLSVALAICFGSHVEGWDWAVVILVLFFGWLEWIHTSIRRKLPVSSWPKPLFL